MQAAKISITLSPALASFVETYKNVKGCKSRSQVIELALELLREKELEQAYAEASTEIDADWDAAIADGLADETW
jgi:antitoxin ParD1/3/4